MTITLGSTTLCAGQTRNNTGAPVGPRDIRDAETPGVVIREYVGVDRVVGDRVGCDHGTVTHVLPPESGVGSIEEIQL